MNKVIWGLGWFNLGMALMRPMTDMNVLLLISGVTIILFYWENE